MSKMDTEQKTDQLGKRLGNLTADLKRYVEKRLELILLNIGEQISSWMAASIYRFSGVIILLLGFIFMLTALAIFVGDLIGSEPLGYVIVAVPLLIFGMLFLYLKPANLIEKMEQSLESEVIKAVSKIEIKETAELPGRKKSESGDKNK